MARVALARAMLRKPELLVLDEPPEESHIAGEAALYELIAGLRDAFGTAILLVSHDLHVVMAAADHVVCLNRHVCCEGVPETVAQHPEYVRLFGDAGPGVRHLSAPSRSRAWSWPAEPLGPDVATEATQPGCSRTQTVPAVQHQRGGAAMLEPFLVTSADRRRRGRRWWRLRSVVWWYGGA